MGGGYKEMLHGENHGVFPKQLGVFPDVGFSVAISIALHLRLAIYTKFHQAWVFRPSVPTKSITQRERE